MDNTLSAVQPYKTKRFSMKLWKPLHNVQMHKEHWLMPFSVPSAYLGGTLRGVCPRASHADGMGTNQRALDDKRDTNSVLPRLHSTPTANPTDVLDHPFKRSETDAGYIKASRVPAVAETRWAVTKSRHLTSRRWEPVGATNELPSSSTPSDRGRRSLI